MTIQFMRWLTCVCAAAAMALGQSSGAAPPPASKGAPPAIADAEPPLGTVIATVELDKPYRFNAKPAKGKIISGTATAWDSDGLSGEFGELLWLGLTPSELRKHFEKVMDKKSVPQWLRYAELQAALGNDPSAASAWKKALALDHDAADEVDASKSAGTAMRKRQLERERMDREGAVQGFASEDGRAPTWPVLSDAEREAALATMRADAERYAAMAGVSVKPVETEYFILVSELKPSETKEIQAELDAMYRRVLQLLGVDPKVNLFWGKAVVFLFATEDRFKAVEAGAFSNPMVGRPGSGTVMGLCHTMREKVFVNSWRSPDYALFGSVLIHETVHGIMHRYSTPARLPSWADEGFSDWVAAQFQPGTIERARREQAMQYIRSGGNIVRILDMNYRDGSWPGDNAIGYAVGYAIVDAMMRESAGTFEQWLKRVKSGEPWEQALQQGCHLSKEQLAANVARFFATRD